MTAAELIEKLEKLAPDTVVWHWNDGCGCCDPGYAPLVFMAGEGADGTVTYSMEADPNA